MTHFPGNEQPMLSSHYLSEEHPPFAGALLTALWSEQHQELCTAPATPDPQPGTPQSQCSPTGFAQHPKLAGDFHQILSEQKRIGDGRDRQTLSLHSGYPKFGSLLKNLLVFVPALRRYSAGRP